MFFFSFLFFIYFHFLYFTFSLLPISFIFSLSHSLYFQLHLSIFILETWSERVTANFWIEWQGSEQGRGNETWSSRFFVSLLKARECIVFVVFLRTVFVSLDAFVKGLSKVFFYTSVVEVDLYLVLLRVITLFISYLFHHFLSERWTFISFAYS